MKSHGEYDVRDAAGIASLGSKPHCNLNTSMLVGATSGTMALQIAAATPKSAVKGCQSASRAQPSCCAGKLERRRGVKTRHGSLAPFGPSSGLDFNFENLHSDRRPVDLAVVPKDSKAGKNRIKAYATFASGCLEISSQSE